MARGRRYRTAMGLRWHLVEFLGRRAIAWPELEAKLGFTVGSDLKGQTPPIDLSLPIVADLCEALGCQPGDLLSFQPEDPAAQAEQALAQDLSFQAFLAYKKTQ